MLGSCCAATTTVSQRNHVANHVANEPRDVFLLGFLSFSYAFPLLSSLAFTNLNSFFNFFLSLCRSGGAKFLSGFDDLIQLPVSGFEIFDQHANLRPLLRRRRSEERAVARPGHVGQECLAPTTVAARSLCGGLARYGPPRSRPPVKRGARHRSVARRCGEQVRCCVAPRSR